MSVALPYREPYRLPAGLLALGVHAAFFLLLTAGLRWQAHNPESYAVELWAELPSPVEPQPPQAVPAAPTAPAPPQKIEIPPAVRAGIELKQKTAPKVEAAKPDARALKAQREAEERRLLDEYAEKRRVAEQERVRAETSAAMAAEVGRYQDMIRGKIRRNIVMPPDVPDSAEAEFKVTLLPGGMVLDVLLLKSSGNTAYDNAAERAVYKAQPLPLPNDPALQNLFRELRLKIRP